MIFVYFIQVPINKLLKITFSSEKKNSELCDMSLLTLYRHKLYTYTYAYRFKMVIKFYVCNDCNTCAS